MGKHRKAHSVGLPKRANLGCGFVVPNNWLNVDSAVGARLAQVPLFGVIAKRLGWIEGAWPRGIIIHNLRRPLPFASGELDFVYASHVIEHFSRAEAIKLLRDCRRVIKSGGHIRIVVPDLREIVFGYTSGRVPAVDFLDKLHTVYPEYPNRVKTALAKFFVFPHRCMYDIESLIELLTEAGFANVRECEAMDSVEDAIRDVEFENRIVGAVVVEAEKL